MFNLTGSSWSLLEPSSGDTRPTARAFHAASFRSGMLYVHGGNDYLLGNNERGGTSFMKLCGLDDLWSFDVSTRAWVKIHDFEGTLRCQFSHEKQLRVGLFTHYLHRVAFTQYSNIDSWVINL